MPTNQLVGLSTVYLYVKNRGFVQILQEALRKRSKNRTPDIWELFDDSYHSLLDDNLDLLQKIVSEHLRFSVHCPYTDINIADIDSNRRKDSIRRLEASIESGTQIGAEYWVLHPGSFSEKEDRRRSLELNWDSIQTLYEYAKKMDVTLGLENMPMEPFLMTTPDDFELLFKNSGVDLKVVFDVGHAHIQKLEKDFISRLSHKFMAIHISDNDGSFDEHLPIGEGTVDWRYIFSELSKHEFNGYYIIESYTKPFESITRLRKHLISEFC